MSLLLNDIIILNNETSTDFEKEETLNKETSTDFEKEETLNKEIRTFLNWYKIKQTCINNKIYILNNLQSLNKVFFKTINKESSNNFVIYIIHVSILKKNTTIHVTDTKGQLKLFCSASSSLKLSGRQKKMQPKILISLLQYFLKNKAYLLKNKKYKKNIPIALHSKYISESFLKIVIEKLKKENFFNIKTINYFNFYPHNGCRPKKVKRIKRRTKKKNKNFL